MPFSPLFFKYAYIQTGVFEQFVRNPSCRHIMFGACHDNGYVRMLEDFAVDHAVAERVTLLYSFHIGKEFDKLPFKSTKMDAIFRTASPEGSNTATSVSYQGVSRTEYAHITAPKTWAALARRNGDSGEVAVPAETNNLSSRTVLVNAAGHRVDVKLPQPSQAALESWKRKVKVAGMRYCRMYHLSGGCHGGCGYSHGPLSDEEKVVYRRNLRVEFCHTGLGCRDASCYYGHNCSCNKPKCKFPPEMHGIAEATAEVWMG